MSQEYKIIMPLDKTIFLVQKKKISLSAVRNIDVVIKRLLEEKNENYLRIDGKIFCPESYKRNLADSIKKIYNNNDKNLFFLKSSPENDLTEDSCQSPKREKGKQMKNVYRIVSFNDNFKVQCKINNFWDDVRNAWVSFVCGKGNFKEFSSWETLSGIYTTIESARRDIKERELRDESLDYSNWKVVE